MQPKSKRALLLSIIALALSACGLTPKQIEAIGKAKSSATMCHTGGGYGVTSTTVVTVAGDGKQPVMVQVAPNCGTVNSRAP
jgi:hypothetical protein